MIPEEMTAIAVEGGKGPASALHAVRRPTPAPGPGQVLIRVRAAGVNRPDIIQRLGFYPPPPGAPDTLGLEVAGEVAALGPGAGRWRVGDRVTALLGGGGYAEYAAVDARHALPVPGDLSFVEAAALPETVFTVFANVFEIGALAPGERLLVHGATSGIGVAAIQMAKAAGARVIATARGPDKAAEARRLGADLAIDAADGRFAEAVLEDGGCDVVLDMVGADYARQAIDCLRPGGRLVMIATQAGTDAQINLLKVMQKRLVISGSTLRPRNADEKARLAAEIEARVWPQVADRRVCAVVDAALPLAEAAQAHARLEGGAHVGKIVLVP